jgi:hypothetical protein
MVLRASERHRELSQQLQKPYGAPAELHQLALADAAALDYAVLPCEVLVHDEWERRESLRDTEPRVAAQTRRRGYRGKSR